MAEIKKTESYTIVLSQEEAALLGNILADTIYWDSSPHGRLADKLTDELPYAVGNLKYSEEHGMFVEASK